MRSVGDIVLDDTFFDREEFGPGWEQESSDKAWAAGVGALSLNHNSVAVYITPAERIGARARIELEPEARDYFVVDGRVATVRANGRRRLRPHTVSEGERTRIVVEGRVPLHGETVVMFRRVGNPTFYYGQTLRMLLRQRGIRVSGKVRRGEVPQGAVLIQSYDSPALAEIVRDMNKVSSNFIAEMLIKTLGAELKGAPGSWPKGLEVAQDLLAELGLPRGTYVLKNGSGLNDTNRFTPRQMATLLQAVWKRFPVAAEFISSLGIAARDGTMRLRMEGTDAAGRLRAKTGTLDRVTALSGYVQSLGRRALRLLGDGERLERQDRAGDLFHRSPGSAARRHRRAGGRRPRRRAGRACSRRMRSRRRSGPASRPTRRWHPRDNARTCPSCARALRTERDPAAAGGARGRPLPQRSRPGRRRAPRGDAALAESLRALAQHRPRALLAGAGGLLAPRPRGRRQHRGAHPAVGGLPARGGAPSPTSSSLPCSRTAWWRWARPLRKRCSPP